MYLKIPWKKNNYYFVIEWDPSEGWFGWNSSGVETPSQETHDDQFKYWIYQLFGFSLRFGKGINWRVK